MTLNEEQRLSLEVGEFMHTVANVFFGGENIGSSRCQIIVEISEALRCSAVSDESAPLLSKEGFKLSEHPRSTWVELATRLIGANDNEVSDIIEKNRNKK